LCNRHSRRRRCCGKHLQSPSHPSSLSHVKRTTRRHVAASTLP
jgi:hypothetical protein